MRNNRKASYVFSFLIGFMLILGTNFALSQKHFYMKEKQMYEKFKMATKYFEKGKSYFQNEKFKKAEEEFNTCIEKMPEHVYAHFYLTQILNNKGDLDKALEHIQRAKENFEIMADLHAYSYQQYCDKLRSEKGQLQTELRDLKDKLPGIQDPELKSRYERAITEKEHRVSTITSRLAEPFGQERTIPADYFYWHGNVFYKLKKFQEAHRQYLEAVKRNPQHGNAYNNLANLYYMAKQYQKALEYLKHAEEHGVEVNPEFKKAIQKALEK